VCASGNAKATGWFHAGQAKKRVGVIALTRGDKEPAVLAFGPDRQPLDIGDQLLAVGFSDEFAFGCTGRKTPDATRFLTDIKRAVTRIDDAAFGLGGNAQGTQRAEGKRWHKIDRDLADSAVLQRRIGAHLIADPSHAETVPFARP